MPSTYTRDVVVSFEAWAAKTLGKEDCAYLRTDDCPNEGFSGAENLRSHCSDVPMLSKLVQAATVVDDPDEADLFVVPYFLGCDTVMGWGASSALQRVNQTAREEFYKALSSDESRLLPHFKSRPADHLFLNPVDAMFQSEDVAGSIVTHTGAKYLNAARRDASIPHLTSLPRDDPGTDGQRPDRPIFAFMMAGLDRNEIRVEIAEQLREAANATGGTAPKHRVELWSIDEPIDAPASPASRALAAAAPLPKLPTRNAVKKMATLLTLPKPARSRPLPTWVGEERGTERGAEGPQLIEGSVLPAADVMERMRSSVFCIVPSGDGDGFCQRLWQVLAAGCIPVRVDSYYPNATYDEIAYPFKQTIDWRKAVVLLPPSELKTTGLMATLRAITPSEVEDRLAYVRDVVRPAVLVDFEGRAPDAFSALLAELLHLTRDHRAARARGTGASEGSQARARRRAKARASARAKAKARATGAALARARRRVESAKSASALVAS